MDNINIINKYNLYTGNTLHEIFKLIYKIDNYEGIQIFGKSFVENKFLFNLFY